MHNSLVIGPLHYDCHTPITRGRNILWIEEAVRCKFGAQKDDIVAHIDSMGGGVAAMVNCSAQLVSVGVVSDCPPGPLGVYIRISTRYKFGPMKNQAKSVASHFYFCSAAHDPISHTYIDDSRTR